MHGQNLVLLSEIRAWSPFKHHIDWTLDIFSLKTTNRHNKIDLLKFFQLSSKFNIFCGSSFYRIQQETSTSHHFARIRNKKFRLFVVLVDSSYNYIYEINNKKNNIFFLHLMRCIMILFHRSLKSMRMRQMV